jgi:D-threo-aldose 1-dehydrogenase
MPPVLPLRTDHLRLGFGCSLLMASLGRAESLRLLQAAFDCGIRHFDVARSYGYGEAESVLGEFARRRRGDISITSKLGIAPPPRYLSAAPVKRIARTLVRSIPALRPLLRRTAGSMTTASRFDVQSARQSLETSLRALGTDYLDVLLLHDCTVDEASNPALREFLDQCVQQGKVRQYGVATSRAVVVQTAASFTVSQFPDDLQQSDSLFDALPQATFPITHSVLARDLQRLKGDAQLTRSCSDRLGLDLSDPTQAALLILCASLRRNLRGCVLYSSRNETRLRATLSALSGNAVSDSQITQFAAIVAQAAPSPVRSAA